MELILKKVIKTHIHSFLEANDFKKKSNYYYKKENGFIYAIWVPIDREYTENGAYFTVQFGIYSETLEVMLGREIKAFPKGYDFILNNNVLTLSDKENERYLLENTTDIDDFGAKMQHDLLYAIIFFNMTTTVDSVVNYCLEHNFLVHYEDLMRYLAIKKDDKNRRKYLLKIKEKLYKISDNALSFYEQKSLELMEKYASE